MRKMWWWQKDKVIPFGLAAVQHLPTTATATATVTFHTCSSIPPPPLPAIALRTGQKHGAATAPWTAWSAGPRQSTCATNKEGASTHMRAKQKQHTTCTHTNAHARAEDQQRGVQEPSPASAQARKQGSREICEQSEKLPYRSLFFVRKRNAVLANGCHAAHTTTLSSMSPVHVNLKQTSKAHKTVRERK